MDVVLWKTAGPMGISLGGIIVFVCLLGEAEGLKCSHSERKNLLKAIGSLV